MSNPYWDGTRLARLTPKQVTAAWGRPGRAFSLTSIALVNRAFEIYYRALRKIRECPDPEQARQMVASLRDAARTGWGFGISDLEEAFAHLHANRGRWTDNATKNYYGGPNKVFQATIVEAPVSIVNFMNAVDSRMGELRKIVQHYERSVRDMRQARRQGAWERIGRILFEVHRWGTAAKPLLWFSPKVRHRIENVVTFAGVLFRIHSGTTMYYRSRAAGFDDRTAKGLAALRTAMTWVPVLGVFYGQAVEMIPSLAAWMRNLVRNRVLEIERAAGMY